MDGSDDSDSGLPPRRHDDLGPYEHPKYKSTDYDALPKKRGAIRILQLLPSDKSNPRIECNLITPGDGDDKIHTYEALSWCWGKDDATEAIIIRKERKYYAKMVKPNLYAALKALRFKSEPRYIWADAVCIDQDHLDEKNHQVEMMNEIYDNAEQVCIWLGESDESSRIALHFIKHEVLQLKKFDKLCESKDASRKWHALLELMQREWFSRRWVVQEIALARKALIHCGQDTISWDKFAVAVELFVEVETATHRLSEVLKTDPEYFHLLGWFENVSALGASLLVDATERLFRDKKEKRQPTALLDNLDQSSEPESDSDSDTKKKGAKEWKDFSLITKSRMQPLLSLEFLVSSLTIFDTTVPHDTIYALLAIAKDTSPKAAPGALDSSDHTRDGLEFFTQSKLYTVDYKLPYVEVCKGFIQFSIDRSLQTDRSRALDVICRPWATEEKTLARRRSEEQDKKKEEKKAARRELRLREKRYGPGFQPHQSDAVQNQPCKRCTNNPASVCDKCCPVSEKPNEQDRSSSTTGKRDEGSDMETNDREKIDTFEILDKSVDMPLPSWIPQLSHAPYGMYENAGIDGPRMNRKNADPLVGLPSLTQRNYTAAQTKKIDMRALKFRKRPKLLSQAEHYSMYVRGFLLDTVDEVEEVARNGHIPKEWALMGGWPDATGPPPDDFWRTLVADRGRDGKNPPFYYSRACEESFRKGAFASGAVNTTDLIRHERNSVVAQFCRRVQAVVWNKALIKTKEGRLGLVRKGVKSGDKVCIIYGCSVPLILRENERKDEDIFSR
ncbi:HET-domain-containing protein, partial [Polyplosphaeria fusca]